MARQTFHNLSREKQARILNSAMEEFIQYPFEKASISRITKNADIPQGSFYQYFENKEDLYIQCMDAVCKRLDIAWSDTNQNVFQTSMNRLATLGPAETQKANFAELEKTAGALDVQFMTSYLKAPRRIRNLVLTEVNADLVHTYVLRELESDPHLRPGYNPDFFAYLFSMAEYLSMDYASRRGLTVNDAAELQSVYLETLYNAIRDTSEKDGKEQP